MIPSTHRTRFRLVVALDESQWRRPAKGLSHKTAIVTREHGLIDRSGPWSGTEYRLTAKGAILKEWLLRQAPRLDDKGIGSLRSKGGAGSVPRIDLSNTPLWRPPPSKIE